MSYIGNQPPDIGAYDVESFDGGGTSFTLKRAATVSSVLLFIDGVRQTPTDAYTVSGTALTTTATTPSGTDNVTVMFMGDVVDIGAPSSDTITSAMIVDGSVANADMADMAANTIKVRDANSSGVPSDKALATTEVLIGDGTGFTAAALSGDVTMTNTGAVTIATDAVDIAMLSATGTASASTFLRGDNAWAAATTAARYVYAYLETSHQAVSSGVDTLVQLNGATQSHSAYNTGTYTWTATADDAGIWVFIAQCSVHYDSSNGDQSKTYIYLNNVKSSGALAWTWTGGTDYLRHYTFSQQYLVSISESDTIKMYASLSAPSGTINLFSGDVATGPKGNSLLGFKL